VYVEETVDVFREVDSLPGTFAADTTVVDTLVSPTGGTQMLFLNAEYRFPLSLSGRIGGVVFIDMGQVSDPRDQAKDTGIRITPGVGLRVFTPLGPIRLDLAYNPHGPEEGPLFARRCTERPDQRTCEDAILVDDAFVPVLGDGLFGLGKHIPFLRQVRVNFSIGQAF
jgi:outer membrane protein assembly factor BamA